MDITSIVELVSKAWPTLAAIVTFIVGYDRLGRRMKVVEVQSRKNAADLDGIGTKVGRLFSWRKVAHNRLATLEKNDEKFEGELREHEINLPTLLKDSRHDVLNQMNPIILRLDEKIEASDRRAADANTAVRERLAALTGNRVVDHQV